MYYNVCTVSTYFNDPPVRGKAFMMAEGTHIEIREIPAQPVVLIRSNVQVAQLGEIMGERFPALLNYIEQAGAQVVGPAYVRYHTFDHVESDLETGFPVAAQVEGEGRFEAGELPEGSAISTWHFGPHEALGLAYERIGNWLKENNREANGPNLEVYHWIDPTRPSNPSNDQPDNQHVELVQPLR